MRLKGKVALVTGAGSGIGRTLALGLAAQGALVHVNDLEGPADVHAELPAERRGLSLPCDVSDVAGLRDMFSRLDRLDVLVNCAGIVGWTDVLEPSEETWDRVIDTNGKSRAAPAPVPMRRGDAPRHHSCTNRPDRRK